MMLPSLRWRDLLTVAWTALRARWSMGGAAAGALVVVVMAVFLAWLWTGTALVPLYDQLPGEVTHAFPSGTGSDEQAPTAIAFAYCNRLRDAETTTWLAQMRRANEERFQLSPMTKMWRRRRCLLPPTTVVAIDAMWLVSQVGDNGAPPPPPAFWDVAAPLSIGAAWEQVQPRVKEVIIDRRGQLYYRVWILQPGSRDSGNPARPALRQRLIAHDQLVATLEEWWRQVQARLSEARVLARPCVCPIHFGIVGSGMHFLAEGQRPLLPGWAPDTPEHTWRILLDVDHTFGRLNVRPGAAAAAERNDTSVAMYDKHAQFPTAVDRALWRTLMGERPFSVRYWDGLEYTAHDAAELRDRAVVEEFDTFARYQWVRDAPVGRAATGADADADESEEDEAHQAAQELEDEMYRVGPRLRATDALGLALSLDAVAIKTHVHGRITSDEFARCYFHCQELETAMRAFHPLKVTAAVAKTGPPSDDREMARAERILKKRDERRTKRQRRNTPAPADDDDDAPVPDDD